MDASGSYALAYLPRPTSCTHTTTTGTTTTVTPFSPTTSLVLTNANSGSVNNSLGIVCSDWTAKWTSPAPGAFADAVAGCNVSANGSTVTFSVKANTVTCGASCDRVLQLTRKVHSTGNSPNIVFSGTAVDLEPGVTLSDDGQTATITGQLSRNGLPMGGAVVLSGTNGAFRKLPSVALDAASNFLVVWEEENPDGTDDVVATRFDSRGRPLGSPFVVNDTTEGQQSEPWVSGDDSGNTVAVWTSYSDDDTIAGDIYGKVFDSSGQPLGPEFLISTDNLGNQILPQVQMDGDGGFVVAWTDESAGDPPPASLAAATAKAKGFPGSGRGVYYRVFDSAGRPRGASRRVESGDSGQDRLTRLEVQRHGGFKLHWRGGDAGGHGNGEHEQDCDQDGNPTGNH